MKGGSQDTKSGLSKSCPVSSEQCLFTKSCSSKAYTCKPIEVSQECSSVEENMEGNIRKQLGAIRTLNPERYKWGLVGLRMLSDSPL